MTTGTPSDPVLAVLEAAGRAPWLVKGGNFVHHTTSASEAHARRSPCCSEIISRDEAAAIVRAVNTFAGAREALADNIEAASLYLEMYQGHTSQQARRGPAGAVVSYIGCSAACSVCRTWLAREKARAALAAMEGKGD